MKKSCAEGNEIFIFVEMKIVKRLSVDWCQPSSKQCIQGDGYGGIHISQIEQILPLVPLEPCLVSLRMESECWSSIRNEPIVCTCFLYGFKKQVE